MSLFIRVLACLALAFAVGATACQTGGTEPDYRPNNPPPAPQHVPRALEHGGHMGMGMSNGVSDEEAEKLKQGAEPSAPEPSAPALEATQAE